MSIAKRIIPCLDVKDGTTVKGTCFVNLCEAGDPVELGKAYSLAGADELVYLDITASHEGRKTFTEIVERVAAEINIPFTVGGGIGSLDDVERLLNAGADKVSVNSAALRRPQLIDEIAARYGNQVCVCAIDARFDEATGWQCYLNGGRLPVGRNLFDWAHEVQERGAGEIRGGQHGSAAESGSAGATGAMAEGPDGREGTGHELDRSDGRKNRGIYQAGFMEQRLYMESIYADMG